MIDSVQIADELNELRTQVVASDDELEEADRQPAMGCHGRKNTGYKYNSSMLYHCSTSD